MYIENKKDCYSTEVKVCRAFRVWLAEHLERYQEAVDFVNKYPIPEEEYQRYKEHNISHNFEGLYNATRKIGMRLEHQAVFIGRVLRGCACEQNVNQKLLELTMTGAFGRLPNVCTFMQSSKGCAEPFRIICFEYQPGMEELHEVLDKYLGKDITYNKRDYNIHGINITCYSDSEDYSNGNTVSFRE